MKWTAILLWIGALAASGSPAQAADLSVKKEAYGKLPSGEVVDVYTLTNAAGLEARVMTFGATLLTMKTPDRNGRLDSVTLHLDSLEEYVKGHPLFGSTVGRYANRIANATFVIDGTRFNLAANAAPHHIHGGNKEAFARANFKAQAIEEKDAVSVKLTHISPDGDAGFPGKVEATVFYQLTRDNRLIMQYMATTDRATHFNLTNHAYWNLAGAGNGDVLKQILTLNAEQVVVPDKDKIPTGELRAVTNTPFDFTKPMAVGSRIDQVDDRNYDHCFVVSKKEPMMKAARLEDPASGRIMEVFTTQPGVQVFTARFLSDRIKSSGRPLMPYAGICFEAQAFPDSPNRKEFPSTLLRPGETYLQTTVHRFSTAP